MAVHSRLDIGRWTAEFPLSRLRGEVRDHVLQRRDRTPTAYADDEAAAAHIRLLQPRWDIVVGPQAVAVNEQLRAERLAAGEYRGRRAATDVAVWAEGEPADRRITKVGGLPYRPAGAPWPLDASGRAARFVGQLCFADSRDLVPPLPGDVLLLFGDDEALLDEPERLVFEWWPLAGDPVVSQTPAFDDALAPFHAVLHRTEDWDDAVFEGTKIGGVPKFIQDEPMIEGTFIGAIGSISVASDARYPFVNVAGSGERSDENDLMIGDMGSVYLFLAPDGRVRAVSQCY